ncbi:MAG: hypothetical protein QY332_18390 [Anaerolineales bacterium]|nr:MAG: hypothetical protein QY332_18390 [Anaerolineales bacterium]
MKSQYGVLFAFVAFLMAVSLACGALGTPPTATPVPTNTPLPTNPPPPTNPPLPTASAPQLPQNTPQQTVSSDPVVFVDENNLLAFELPGDWYYEHTVGDYLYVDTFTSPDGVSALIESLVYNDGKAINNSVSTAFALNLLNQYYSYTGKEGDIRVSSHQKMNDGSERLVWKSKGGEFSGITFFEVRGADRKTFLLFTLKYSDYADQSILDTLDNTINTYYVP